MAGIYGAGIYGNGDYSASTLIDMSATVLASYTLYGEVERLRSLAATFSGFSFTATANLDATFDLKADFETAFELDADLKVVHQYLLSATIVVDLDISHVNLNAEYSPTITFSLAPTIEMTPYIGPFWADDGAGGNWTPETPQNDIWVPETEPQNPWS